MTDFFFFFFFFFKKRAHLIGPRMKLNTKFLKPSGALCFVLMKVWLMETNPNVFSTVFSLGFCGFLNKCWQSVYVCTVQWLKVLLSPNSKSSTKQSGLLFLNFIDTNFNASTTDRFENIVGKEEIAHNEQFLLFQQCSLLDQKIVSPFVKIFEIICLFAAELEEPKEPMWGKGLMTAWSRPLNPFPHNDAFWCPWETSLLKRLWEKEKLLVTSNFSFSHSVFYPFR